jgi:TnpA family transposase
VHQQLTEELTEAQRIQIRSLLTVSTPRGQSLLGWLRQPPGAASPASFQKVVERLRWIRDVGLDPQVRSRIHHNRLQQLRREGERMTAQRLNQLDDAHRDATLVAFLLATEEELIDQALDMHDKLLHQQGKRGEQKQEDRLKQSRKAIHEKVRLYARVGKALITAKEATQDAYAAIEAVLSWQRFVTTVNEAEQLTTTTEVDTVKLLVDRYPQLRKYTKELVATFTFQATKANEPLLQALDVLKELNETGRRAIPQQAPTDFVDGKWEPYVVKEETIDRHAYELCVLSELRHGLRSGDIWINRSRQHKALEEYLLSETEWQGLKEAGTTEIKGEMNWKAYLEERRETLNAHLKTVEKLMAEEALPDVRWEKGKLVITPLTKDVPDEVKALTRQLYNLLPRIKLPDLLLEIDSWTQYSRHFTHLQTGDACRDRMALLTALLAEALNLGLVRMAEACEGMTFSRLTWAVDWHMRDENYTKALAEVINYHHRHPFAATWGDGTTSSSDGQRFKVSGRRSPVAQVKLRYGTEPGISFYTHLSDQYGPYRVKVISATARDAPHMVDGLLYHETDLDIHEHYTDTGGITDQIFGITRLLGFEFAPRIRDLGESLIFPIDKLQSYPNLAPLLGGMVNIKHIESSWDDLLRLTSSLHKGTVTASLILGKLASYPRQNGLALALREFGRIERSIFALKWLQSPPLRRRVQVGLNKGEARNALARAVCHYQLGEIRDRSYEDQQYRASGLNLVVAAIILWNTVYLAEAVEQLRRDGVTIKEEDLRHVSPLGWEHINLTGDFHWNVKQVPPNGQLRPLRTKQP